MLGPYNNSNSPITIFIVALIVIIVPLLFPYFYHCAPYKTTIIISVLSRMLPMSLLNCTKLISRNNILLLMCILRSSPLWCHFPLNLSLPFKSLLGSVGSWNCHSLPLHFHYHVHYITSISPSFHYHVTTFISLSLLLGHIYVFPNFINS